MTTAIRSSQSRCWPAAQRGRREDRADYGHEHLPLGVPRIAWRPRNDGSPPAVSLRAGPFGSSHVALIARQTHSARNGNHRVPRSAVRRQSTSRTAIAGTKPCRKCPSRS